jgi:type II secretory pathway pseudopilin PulG
MIFTRTKTAKTQKTQLNSSGFTIVELLIFIAVSLALFVSAMMVVGGRQHKTEFQTGVNEFVQQLQSIANDVSSGNYERPLDLWCDTSSGSVNFGLSTVAQPGKNSDCIFIGRAVQFAPQGSDFSEYRVFSIIGKRLYSPAVGTSRDVRSLSEAEPKVLNNLPGGAGVSTVRVPGGLRIVSADLVGSTDSVGTIAFYTDFAKADAAGNIESGTRNVVAMPVKNTNLNQNSDLTIPAIETDLTINPGAVVLCVEHEAAGRSALIRIGSAGGSTTVNSRIQEGGC